MNRQCECEHIAHFEHDQHTPNGNPGHRPDAYFHPDTMERVKTTFGTFMVCRDCAHDCLKEITA